MHRKTIEESLSFPINDIFDLFQTQKSQTVLSSPKTESFQKIINMNIDDKNEISKIEPFPEYFNLMQENKYLSEENKNMKELLRNYIQLDQDYQNTMISNHDLNNVNIKMERHLNSQIKYLEAERDANDQLKTQIYQLKQFYEEKLEFLVEENDILQRQLDQLRKEQSETKKLNERVVEENQQMKKEMIRSMKLSKIDTV